MPMCIGGGAGTKQTALRRRNPKGTRRLREAGGRGRGGPTGSGRWLTSGADLLANGARAAEFFSSLLGARSPGLEQ
jgi:hypothetical protein